MYVYIYIYTARATPEEAAARLAGRAALAAAALEPEGTCHTNDNICVMLYNNTCHTI